MDSEGGECMRSMTDRFDYLKIALEGRYAIERELGEGGMARKGACHLSLAMK